ncbi:MAG: esterase-like activity of phytase family protein [Pseudomonadota bacterium]
MIRILACLSLIVFLVPVTYVRGPTPPPNDSQFINLERLAFDSSNPKRVRTGRLEFLDGWKLTSENSSFGGISSMLLLPEDRFFMLSDAGVLIGFTLDADRNRAVRPFIAPLPDGPPRENPHARLNWDAESLLHDPETQRFWVGFERQHSVWRYSLDFERKESMWRVPAMANWPLNGGAEAMLRLPDGRFLVFSESAEYEQGGSEALIFNGDPSEPGTASELFGYRPPQGYNLTDASLLPDGTALLLHRRFTPLEGVSAILSIADPSEIAAGKVWTSRRIAVLKPPMTIDNMEALAISQEMHDGKPATIIWIASDDNFQAIQESILLKFRLLKGRKRPSGKKTAPETEKAEEIPGSSSLRSEKSDRPEG